MDRETEGTEQEFGEGDFHKELDTKGTCVGQKEMASWAELMINKKRHKGRGDNISPLENQSQLLLGCRVALLAQNSLVATQTV